MRFMYAIHRILVAVKEPRAKGSAALDKAARLAHALGAEVRLFHAIADPIYLDAAGSLAQAYPRLEQDRRGAYRDGLERLAAPLQRRGIRVGVSVEWDFPVYEAIVREAAHFEADLIVAESHARAHHAPWLLRFTDWELLRRSPVPVLLVKSRRAYRRPKVLAALDPARAFGKPANLDAEILRYGSTVASALHGALHAVHAYSPGGQAPLAAALRRRRTASGVEFGGGSATSNARGRREADAAWRARSALHETLRWSAIPAPRVHLVGSPPAAAIEQTLNEISASILVIGTLARSGFRRLFVGNTAERLLDRIRCDVLAVKPIEFRNVIAREPRGLQTFALPE